MQVTRNRETADPTYDVQGLTESQAAMLGALADFPHWSAQPKEVAAFCAALHTSVSEVVPVTATLSADAHSMAPVTTVEPT